MNAVEIDEALSELASAPFDPFEFPYAFLRAFGIKETTIARLRKGETNASDVGGVLQRANIHIAVAEVGDVRETLCALRQSSKTATAKAKFILATDGQMLEAEDLNSGEPLSTSYQEFADHFGFFLPLAGITTTKEIKNNPIDVKATGRLNRLYIELLKNNPDWGTPERRHDLNQFMSRLIFCFFAEDTGIFNGTNLFTSTLERMSTTEAGSVERVLIDLFRAMDIAPADRSGAKLRSWADAFPYVNGGLFAGSKPCPCFSRVARSYLLRAGELNWKEINPDIFGSMIQAVADDEERASLGQHYTSVPNIMKVLGPLFLNDLKTQLDAAAHNDRKLRNLRKRMANVRVFDPACGSGNFLVIAYIRMREIEHEIVRQTGDDPRSIIPLANFYGIEIKDFAAEIARLALLIAEFQCDVRYIDQQTARSLVLPLKRTGQIHTANALRANWFDICPRWAFGEVYVCGNPPYLGSKKKSADHVADMNISGLEDAKLLDYVAAFIIKACDFSNKVECDVALVTTSSICQGEQVALLWPKVLATMNIVFAYRPFKWSNNAANNAGVFVTIVGLSNNAEKPRFLYDGFSKKECCSISPYLIEGSNIIVQPRAEALSAIPKMEMGSNPVDGKRLILDRSEYHQIIATYPGARKFILPYGGTEEILSGLHRYCIWIDDADIEQAKKIPPLATAIENCRVYRLTAGQDARRVAKSPHKFSRSTYKPMKAINVGKVIGNSYAFIPAIMRMPGYVSSDAAFTVYQPEGWIMALILSRLQKVWAETVAGRLGNGVRYATTVVYNTFPVPLLSETEKRDLEKSVTHILIARENHFPSSISDLYGADVMPDDLVEAHARNDELIERIYIGRRFRNDTERLEKLFDLYAKMISLKEAVCELPTTRRARRSAALE